MQAITTVGFDIAKSVFQVHGVDARGSVVVRRQLKRRYVLGVFQEAAALPGWHRGMRHVASLVARAAGSRTYRASDPSGLCEALRQTPEERRRRCRGHLRGGAAAEHALRADQNARTAELPECSIARGISSSGSRPRSSTRSAHIWPSLALSHRSDATA